MLSKLEMEVSTDEIRDVTTCRPMAIERVLLRLREHIDAALWNRQKANTHNDYPEVDQYHCELTASGAS